MTKPSQPPAANVVEIDAMDVTEWEAGQSTPQASDANLAELVRRSAKSAEAPRAGRERAQTASLASGRSPGTAAAGSARTAPPKPAPRPTRARTEAYGFPLTRPAATPVPTARRPATPPEPVAMGTGTRPATTLDATPGIPVALPDFEHVDVFETTTATFETETVTYDVRPGMSDTANGVVRPASADSAVVSTERLREADRASSPASSPEGRRTLLPLPAPSDQTPRPMQIVPVSPETAPDPVASDEPGRPDEAADVRLSVPLTRRRLWWIGGALTGVSLAVVIGAAVIAGPHAPAEDADAPAPRPAARAAASRGAAAPAAPAAPGSTRTASAAAPPSGAPPSAAPSSATRSAADAAARRAGPEAAPAAAALARPLAPDRTAASSPSSPSSHRAAPPPAKRVASRSKKVVIDYTVRPSDRPPPGLVADSEEDPAIGRARTAYTTGNQKLFQGDLDGAIEAYHEALELYPGYVGGYRGLGLAYAQRGDAASAVAALKTYLAAAPGARDVALIKKRIAHLQGK